MQHLPFLVFALLILCGCTKDDENNDPVGPFSPDIREATYNYDFFSIESEAGPLLIDYRNAYEFTQNPVAYGGGATYQLDQFHLALIIHDETGGNVPAVFVYRPAGSNFASAADLTSVVVQAEDGSSWIRQEDAALSRRMIGALQSPRSTFAPYTENGTDFVVIRFDRERLRNLDRSSRTRWISFFVHEGFHLYPQRAMARPGNSQSGIRSNIPADYPADPESFSLIGAGVQLGENLLYPTGPVDWERALAMQYVLLDRLREADTTGQLYIDEYYLLYAWLEGAAQFVDETITRGTGLYDRDDSFTRGQVSYAAFLSSVENTVLTGNSTVIVNGVPQTRRYNAVVGSTFYELGSTTFRILEGLGEDPFAAIASGRNPYELLDDYITDNEIAIDEEAALADIKASVDWEASLELMSDYIAVFE